MKTNINADFSLSSCEGFNAESKEKLRQNAKVFKAIMLRKSMKNNEQEVKVKFLGVTTEK